MNPQYKNDIKMKRGGRDVKLNNLDDNLSEFNSDLNEKSSIFTLSSDTFDIDDLSSDGLSLSSHGLSSNDDMMNLKKSIKLMNNNKILLDSKTLINSSSTLFKQDKESLSSATALYESERNVNPTFGPLKEKLNIRSSYDRTIIDISNKQDLKTNLNDIMNTNTYDIVYDVDRKCIFNNSKHQEACSIHSQYTINSETNDNHNNNNHSGRKSSNMSHSSYDRDNNPIEINSFDDERNNRDVKDNYCDFYDDKMLIDHIATPNNSILSADLRDRIVTPFCKIVNSEKKIISPSNPNTPFNTIGYNDRAITPTFYRISPFDKCTSNLYQRTPFNTNNDNDDNNRDESDDEDNKSIRSLITNNNSIKNDPKNALAESSINNNSNSITIQSFSSSLSEDERLLKDKYFEQCNGDEKKEKSPQPENNIMKIIIENSSDTHSIISSRKTSICSSCPTSDAPYPTLIPSPSRNMKNIRMKIDLGQSPVIQRIARLKIKPLKKPVHRLLFNNINNNNNNSNNFKSYQKTRYEESSTENYYDFSIKSNPIKQNKETKNEYIDKPSPIFNDTTIRENNYSFSNGDVLYGSNSTFNFENRKRSFDSALLKNNEIYNVVKKIKLNRNNGNNNNKIYEAFLNNKKRNFDRLNDNMEVISLDDEVQCSEDIGEVLYNINKPGNKHMFYDTINTNEFSNDAQDNGNNKNNYLYKKVQDQDVESLELNEKVRSISKNLFSFDSKNKNLNHGTLVIHHKKIEYNEFFEFENLIISYIKKRTPFNIIFDVIQNNKNKLSVNVFKRVIEEGIRKNDPNIIKTVFLIAKSVRHLDTVHFSAEDFQYFLSLIEYRESDVDTFNEVIEGLKESKVNPPALFVIHICSMYMKFKCFEEIDNVLRLYSESFLTNKYQKKQAIHRLISIMIDKRLISQTYNFFVFLDKHEVGIKEKDLVSLGAFCVDDKFINPTIFSTLTKIAVKHVMEYTSPYLYWEKILIHCILKNKIEAAIIIYRKLIKFYLPSPETLKLFLDFSIKHNNLNDFMKRFICNFKILNSESVKQFTMNSLSVPFLNESINYCIASNLYSHAMWLFIFMNRHNIKIDDMIYIKLLTTKVQFKPRDLEDLVDAIIRNHSKIQIDFYLLEKVTEDFYNQKKFNLASKLLLYIKSKSYYQCCMTINLQLKILLNDDNVDEAYKLFLSVLNENEVVLEESDIKKLLDRLIFKCNGKNKKIQFNTIWLVFEYLKKISNFSNINKELFISLIKLIIQENQWTKGMEILKYYGEYQELNYEKNTFISLFKAIESKEFTNNRKEGFIISLFIFCCKNKMINFDKESIKNGVLRIEESLPFSILRLLFIQAFEYIYKNHPELKDTSTSPDHFNDLWWNKEFKVIFPSTIDYHGTVLEFEKYIPVVAEEFKKLCPPFDIYEEANQIKPTSITTSPSFSSTATKKPMELILSKSNIFKWIKSVYNNSYSLFDIIGISSPIHSSYELTTLISN